MQQLELICDLCVYAAYTEQKGLYLIGKFHHQPADVFYYYKIIWTIKQKYYNNDSNKK